MPCAWCCGCAISWKHKTATTSRTTLFAKTTRVQCCWKRTEGSPAPRTPDTWKSDVSLQLTTSIDRNCQCSTALPMTCSVITAPNQSKVPSVESSATAFSISCQIQMPLSHPHRSVLENQLSQRSHQLAFTKTSKHVPPGSLLSSHNFAHDMRNGAMSHLAVVKRGFAELFSAKL